MIEVSKFVQSLIISVFCSGLVSGACPAIYDEIAGGCFMVVETLFDFATARTVCQSYNGDLAVVNDCSLHGSLIAYLQASSYSTSVWIGASDLASEGEWYWIDGTLVEFGAPYWARTSPASYTPEPSGGSVENCAVMSVGAGYYFQDIDCAKYSGYAPLCEISKDPVTGSCPGPYELVGDGKCFLFLSTVDATWEDARVICQSSGGDLAIIDDCRLMKSVIDFAKQTDSVPVTGFWIGGSDAASEGSWTWLDGSSMDMGPTYWGRSGIGSLEPDNNGEQDILVLWSADRFLFTDVKIANELFPLCQTAPIEEK